MRGGKRGAPGKPLGPQPVLAVIIPWHLPPFPTIRPPSPGPSREREGRRQGGVLPLPAGERVGARGVAAALPTRTDTP